MALWLEITELKTTTVLLTLGLGETMSVKQTTTVVLKSDYRRLRL